MAGGARWNRTTGLRLSELDNGLVRRWLPFELPVRATEPLEDGSCHFVWARFGHGPNRHDRGLSAPSEHRLVAEVARAPGIEELALRAANPPPGAVQSGPRPSLPTSEVIALRGASGQGGRGRGAAQAPGRRGPRRLGEYHPAGLTAAPPAPKSRGPIGLFDLVAGLSRSDAGGRGRLFVHYGTAMYNERHVDQHDRQRGESGSTTAPRPRQRRRGGHDHPPWKARGRACATRHSAGTPGGRGSGGGEHGPGCP